MPLIEILSCGKTLVTKNKQGLIRCMVHIATSKLGVEKRQLRVVIQQFTPEDYYDGSNDDMHDAPMVIIRTSHLEGRKTETKYCFVSAVTEEVANTLNIEKRNIRVLLHQYNAEHWGIAGTTVEQLQNRRGMKRDG